MDDGGPFGDDAVVVMSRGDGCCCWGARNHRRDRSVGIGRAAWFNLFSGSFQFILPLHRSSFSLSSLSISCFSFLVLLLLTCCLLLLASLLLARFLYQFGRKMTLSTGK
jgi:hypothetical protein